MLRPPSGQQEGCSLYLMVLLVGRMPEGPSEVFCSCCHLICSLSEIRSSSFAFRLHVGSVLEAQPWRGCVITTVIPGLRLCFVKRGLKELSCRKSNQPVCEEVQREKHESPSELYLQLELEELNRNHSVPHAVMLKIR